MDAADWDDRYQQPGRLWGVEPNLFLVQELADSSPGVALDIACGEGRNAVWLAERGWHVIGVDFSQVALETASEVAASGGVTVEWILADVTEYVPAALAFDLVAIFYLHLSPQARRVVLDGASAAVAPGGTLLVVGHHRDNLEGGYGGPPDPTILYTPDEIEAEIPELHVLKSETLLRQVLVDGVEETAIDALVRAVRR